MTTLPSTTTIRLPRQTAPNNSNLAMPAYPGPALGTASAMNAADVWRVIRGNIWWILGTTALSLAIGISSFFYVRATNPKYRSVGLVVLNRPKSINPTNSSQNNVNDDSDFNLPIEQKTQTQMLMSEALWNDVIEKSTKVRETTWFRKFVAKAKTADGLSAAKMAKDDLAENFRAMPIPDSKLVQITMDCAVPDDAHDILQEIGDSQIEKEQQLTFDRTNQELNTATQWKDRYVKLESQTKSAMNDLNTNVGQGNSPASMNRMNVKELELSQLIGVQTPARMATSDAQAAFEGLTQQLTSGTDPYQVEMIVRNDPSVQRLTASADDLDVRIESMAQSVGDKSKLVDDLRKQQAVTRGKLEKAESNARAIARSQVVDQYKSAFSAAKTKSDSIDSQIETLRNELGDISSKIADYNSLKDEYDGYKELERQMNERVAVLQNALRQQVAVVTWSSSGLPTKPDTLASPSLRVFLPLSILVGFGLSTGLAFLREIANNSVRSPRDISRVGSMNFLGMISIESDDPKAAGVPMHMVISQAPGSMIAEQFRQVRTRLQHAASLDTTRTMVVTSADAGDGKTMIACNLATGLALNGRRILLVDANFRRPELHKLFGVANQAGFSGVLDSVGKLEASIQKTPIPNLELLTSGPRPSNPTEMIESQLFTDFIDRALEEYDHVIFDAGPLLVVSEAVALAPRCDGVITVVRARKNTRGMLTRVREILRQIKAEHLGVVLNGVQTWGGGYYARNIKAYYAYQDEA